MIYMTTHDSLNTLLTQLDAQVKRERQLRDIIDSLFKVICTRCTEEEIQQLECLKDLQELAK